MSKKNKKRYVSKGNVFPRLALSGTVYLKYREPEVIVLQPGDIMLYLHSDTATWPPEKGDYSATGQVGYFKADIFDGKDWKPLLLTGLLENREQYFAKHERPLDTYEICRALLQTRQGAMLMRTYREHYTLEEE